jgi:hypothetical protein
LGLASDIDVPKSSTASIAAPVGLQTGRMLASIVVLLVMVTGFSDLDTSESFRLQPYRQTSHEI